jgi:hypothetical protein
MTVREFDISNCKDRVAYLQGTFGLQELWSLFETGGCLNSEAGAYVQENGMALVKHLFGIVASSNSEREIVLSTELRVSLLKFNNSEGAYFQLVNALKNYLNYYQTDSMN